MKLSISKHANASKAAVEGDFHEGIEDELERAAEELCSADSIVIDCTGLDRINSRGLNLWVRFVNKLGQTAITYECCPPVLIDYFNLSPRLLERASVASLFVPFFCKKCDIEALHLLPTKDLGPHMDYPKCICKICNGELEPRRLAVDYLLFMSG